MSLATPKALLLENLENDICKPLTARFMELYNSMNFYGHPYSTDACCSSQSNFQVEVMGDPNKSGTGAAGMICEWRGWVSRKEALSE